MFGCALYTLVCRKWKGEHQRQEKLPSLSKNNKVLDLRSVRDLSITDINRGREMQSTTTLGFARGLLQVLIALNLVFLLLFVAVGIGSYPYEATIVRALTEDGIKNASEQIEGMRLIMLLGVITVPPAHIILTRLLQIVRSVSTEAAFAPLTAIRLKTIAWALLAIQVLDLALGWVTARFEGAPGWSPSITSWLAVLLLFVLARVFEQGAAMREELDATV